MKVKQREIREILLFVIHLTCFYLLLLCSQVAIDEMQNKVKELNHVISLEPPDMKKLQLKLAGSVSVQVFCSTIMKTCIFVLLLQFTPHSLKLKKKEDFFKSCSVFSTIMDGNGLLE